MSKFLLLVWLVGSPVPVFTIDYENHKIKCIDKAEIVNERNVDFEAECRELKEKAKV